MSMLRCHTAPLVIGITEPSHLANPPEHLELAPSHAWAEEGALPLLLIGPFSTQYPVVSTSKVIIGSRNTRPSSLSLDSLLSRLCGQWQCRELHARQDGREALSDTNGACRTGPGLSQRLSWGVTGSRD